ncbi:MAG: cytochrome c biogenesis CcdA family protein [Candidatus Magnetoovum sp. WYHC-5]|nr:cytochrome c biogenesis CcdA family protein [Candidatus Magnetoovum sp. WYHC-5]
MQDVSFPLAFLAGILSFASPCVLPLFPSYLSFITGVSFENLKEGVDKRRIRFLTITHSIVFICGFTVVFMSLGASSSVLGGFFKAYHREIRIGGAILIIIFGLFVSGLINLDFLLKEKRFYLQGKPAGYVGTFLVGLTFAIGWTPCIGPILGTILLYATTANSSAYGLKLLFVYSLGLALPFLLSSVAFSAFLSQSQKLYRHMNKIMKISASILIIFGLLLLTDNLKLLNTIIPK